VQGPELEREGEGEKEREREREREREERENYYVVKQSTLGCTSKGSEVTMWKSYLHCHAQYNLFTIATVCELQLNG
jgi:hypothetical protein